MIFEFEIPGDPKGKGRPRFTRNGRTFTPAETVRYESLVRACFTETYKGEPVEKGIPLRAHIMAFYPIPKSVSKSRAVNMESGFEFPTKVPDCDNVAKIILDALNGIAYHDDAQIVRLTVQKSYSREPRVSVTIQEYKP